MGWRNLHDGEADKLKAAGFQVWEPDTKNGSGIDLTAIATAETETGADLILISPAVTNHTETKNAKTETRDIDSKAESTGDNTRNTETKAENTNNRTGATQVKIESTDGKTEDTHTKAETTLAPLVHVPDSMQHIILDDARKKHERRKEERVNRQRTRESQDAHLLQMKNPRLARKLCMGNLKHFGMTNPYTFIWDNTGVAEVPKRRKRNHGSPTNTD
jgi:hypothetical protein